MHFFKMCRTEFKRIFNIKVCITTLLISLCVLFMGVVTFIKENGNGDEYFYDIFSRYFLEGTFYQLLFIPVGYYIMYGICTDLKEKMSFFFVTRSNINSYISAKFIVGIIYAFTMFEIIFNLFCLVGINVFKIVDYTYYSGGSDLFEDILKMSPILYFEFRIFIISLFMSLFIGIGMLITTIFLNNYIGALSAFLAYIIIDKIELILNVNKKFYYENIVSVGVRSNPSVIITFCTTVGFFLVSVLFVYILYYVFFRRKLSGE